MTACTKFSSTDLRVLQQQLAGGGASGESGAIPQHRLKAPASIPVAYLPGHRSLEVILDFPSDTT